MVTVHGTAYTSPPQTAFSLGYIYKVGKLPGTYLDVPESHKTRPPHRPLQCAQFRARYPTRVFTFLPQAPKESEHTHLPSVDHFLLPSGHCPQDPSK